MVPPLLNNLGPLILRRICGWVYWEHTKDLLEFALVNKYWYSIAKQLLYRTIHVDLNYEDFYTMEQTVQDCRNILTRDHAFRHVRCLVITSCRMVLGSWRTPSTYRNYQGIKDHRAVFGSSSDRMSRVVSDAMWQLLFDLMTELPGLSDVHYNADCLPPKGLLSALDKKIRVKHCRLHVHSHGQQILDRMATDPDMLAIVQSPYLHSLAITFEESEDGFDMHGRPSYVLEEVTALMTEENLAPELREVYLHCIPVRKADPPPQIPPCRPAWQGPLHTEGGDHTSTAGTTSIRSLIVELPWIPSSWAQRNLQFSPTSLFYLRLLQTSNTLDETTAMFLAGTKFPDLTELKFECRRGILIPLSYFENLKMFLRGAPKLAVLQIMSWRFDRLSLADCLGSGIKTLKLAPYYSAGKSLGMDEISQLVANCPNIRELLMQVDRSRGDSTEVAMYKLIGSMPNLQHLTLCLQSPVPSLYGRADGSTDTAIEPDLDDFEKDYLCNGRTFRHGHLRDDLVNCAIDRKLAVYIFHAISSGKGNNSLPLESLLLRPCRAELLFMGISLSWCFGLAIQAQRDTYITRDMRYGCQDLLRISKPRSLGPGPDLPSLDDLDQGMVQVYRRLWPENGGYEPHTGCWWKDWESKPLAGYKELMASVSHIPHSSAKEGRPLRAESIMWKNAMWSENEKYSRSVIRLLDDGRYTCIWPENSG